MDSVCMCESFVRFPSHPHKKHTDRQIRRGTHMHVTVLSVEIETTLGSPPPCFTDAVFRSNSTITSLHTRSAPAACDCMCDTHMQRGIYTHRVASSSVTFAPNPPVVQHLSDSLRKKRIESLSLSLFNIS